MVALTDSTNIQNTLNNPLSQNEEKICGDILEKFSSSNEQCGSEETKLGFGNNPFDNWGDSHRVNNSST